MRLISENQHVKIISDFFIFIEKLNMISITHFGKLIQTPPHPPCFKDSF